MYLKQAVIENSGPLKWLNLSPAFSNAGLPKPLILVGGNGSGKTNFLSLVADALFEAAAVHYDNVLPHRGMGRAWFRVVGGRNLTVGASGGFSLLEFDDAGTPRLYKEKAGHVDPTAAILRVPQNFSGQLNWQAEGSHKEFPIEDERSRILFQEGVYTYFPSSRSEVPYWLNREAIPETEFDVGPRFSKRLRKAIYVERALDHFKQWIIGIITDARCDLAVRVIDENIQFQIAGDSVNAFISTKVLMECNKLL